MYHRIYALKECSAQLCAEARICHGFRGGIEQRRNIGEQAVCGKTEVDPYLLAERTPYGQEHHEKKKVQEAHADLEGREYSHVDAAVDKVRPAETHEHQCARDKSQEYACKVVSAQVLPLPSKINRSLADRLYYNKSIYI